MTMSTLWRMCLKECDSIWGVTGLIVTCSNLVVTWKVRPHMCIISWFPLGLRWFSQGGCILVHFSCNWKYQFVQKQKTKKITMAYVVDRAFSLGTHIMDRVLVLNMWWIGFWACVGFIHLQHAWTTEVLKGTPKFPQNGYSSLPSPFGSWRWC